MSHDSAAIAKAYYNALAQKDFNEIEGLFHPGIELIAPLAKVKGKEGALEAARNFAKAFRKLKIRTVLKGEDQAVVVYDVEFPDPIGHLPAAALVHVEGGLIIRLELFYDARRLA
ncbi:MAG: nuclear transport factor 2 family protein [Parachlamydiales bacterium]